MTHEQFLQARYDGPILPEALRHAQKLDEADRAAAASRAPTPSFLTAPAPKKPSRFTTVDALLAVMAAVMVDRVTFDGACTDADLTAAGFSVAEIAEHAPAAQIIACARTADRDLGSAT